MWELLRSIRIRSLGVPGSFSQNNQELKVLWVSKQCRCFDLHHLDDGASCALSNLIDDTKLGGVADTPEGCAVVHRDFIRLEKWADRIFEKYKPLIVHPGRNNAMQQCILGINRLESFAKNPGVVDDKLNMNIRQQCALYSKEGQWHLGQY